MKNEKEAAAVVEEVKETQERESLAELIDVVWEINQRCRKIKIMHRALWHFANDVCSGISLKKQQSELYEMLQMLKHHHDRLEDFLGEATKYCDDLEQ